jgi:hypothetical protein
MLWLALGAWLIQAASRNGPFTALHREKSEVFSDFFGSKHSDVEAA